MAATSLVDPIVAKKIGVEVSGGSRVLTASIAAARSAGSASGVVTPARFRS
jgi:hypothetical protein